MPRKPRLFLPEATYHLYCRVARGEFVFDHPQEAEAFVDATRDVRDLDGWRILAWCLMANHYHIVVTTGTVPLWKSMARLQGRVSRGFNKRRRYLGRLWQSRYRARLVDSQPYFLQVISYVHLNPLAAGIVDDPLDYLQSGHREILGRCQPRLVDVHFALAGFGCRNIKRARRAYLEWVQMFAETKGHEKQLRDLPWWAGARDVDEIVSEELRSQAETFDGLSLEEDRPILELDDFVSRFETASGRTIDRISSIRRTEDFIRGRIELTLLAVGRYGYQSAAIAKLIDKDRSSLTRWLNLGLRLQRDNPEFRKRIDDLDRQIAQSPSTMQQ